MSLRIGAVRLRLPAGYAGRAEAIARAIATAAARIPLAGARAPDALSLDRIRVGPAATDSEVAGAVARQLATQLRGRP